MNIANVRIEKLSSLLCGAALVIGLSIAGGAVEAKTSYLTGKQLKSFLVGHTFSIQGSKLHYGANGILTGKSSKSKWWIESNRYCYDLGDNEKKCFLVGFNGKKRYTLYHDHEGKPNNHHWTMKKVN